MARTPKPWFRADRGVWCVTVSGVRHNLGPDKKAAFERFYALMRQPSRQKVSADSLPAIADAFLEWTQRNRARATYGWYLDILQPFVAAHADLPIDQLRPHHVEEWAAEIASNVNTRRNRMRAVKRCLRWAVRQGYLDRNPIECLDIPSPRPRNAYVGPDEFAQALALVQDAGFADLLRVTYQTGCRPQESLRVEARHVDLTQGRWVFPAHEAKVKSMPRVVYLTDEALAITAALIDAHPAGPLFRNVHGRPWNKSSVGCAFQRLQVRLGKEEMRRRGETIAEGDIAQCVRLLSPTRRSGGVRVCKTDAELRYEARRRLVDRRARELGPRYSLYVLRHSWATNALQNGVDALTVAILMGHKDPSTLARTYQHLSHNPEHLRSQAKRASG